MYLAKTWCTRVILHRFPHRSCRRAHLGLLPLLFAHLWASEYVDRGAIGQHDLHSMQKWNSDMSPSHSATCLSRTGPFVEFNLEPLKLSLKSSLFCHHVIIRLLRGCNSGHCPIGSICITHRACDPKRLERLWPEFKQKDAVGI